VCHVYFYVNGPSAKKPLKKLNYFPRKNSKYNISHNLSIKVIKSPPFNPIHWGLFNNTNNMPQFPKLNLIVLKFLLKNTQYSITFTQEILTLQNNMSIHPSSLTVVQWYEECGKGHHGFGDLNMTNKTNKILFLIDK
jgi:hypothetical protein